MSKTALRQLAYRRWLLRATISMLAAGISTPLHAQSAAADEDLEEIIVTGFRKSLAESTAAKRAAVGFTDVIFAEDIGKFPDTNIAESFNRIPGITITREITGEGLQIAIRGLGTNFTRILLNDAPIAIASTGRTDAQSTNREVDLDLFPTELFTKLSVNKSSMAHMLEGGVAGTVNMVSARPFDSEGQHLVYSVQATENSNADSNGFRGSFIASDTWGSFGALVGIAGVHNEVRVTGFETIGWSNPNITAAQCGAGNTCNPTGLASQGWTIPATVPNNAGNDLVAGAAVDQAFLLANNPGLTMQQLDNGLIPRLGRPSDEYGEKDRVNAIVSLEFKPGDDMHFYLDSMWGEKENDLERIDMNWVGRNGATIPLNVQVDRTDCAQGCVVTSGTYANSQFFLEYRPFIEEVDFWGVNPGFDWEISDTLKFSVQGNWTESTFHRESPTFLVITPASSGVTVNYTNNGKVPRIDTNVNLNDPAQFGWPGGRVNIQDEKRETETKGARADLSWGDEDLSVKFGAAYDDVSRSIRAFDNSQEWQNAACGNNPNVFVPTPNTQPPCNGLSEPGAPPVGYPTYPGLGTNYSAGITTPLQYLGSLIPNGAVASYLRPGPSGFVTADWNALARDSDYGLYHGRSPEANGSNTGASAGLVEEQTTGLYTELNGIADVGDNRLRYNVGLRWVDTDQTIGGRISIPDPRNPVAPAAPIADGGRYPNIVNFSRVENSYDNWLPSANLAFDIGSNAVARLGLSRTMTRPNPNSMLPGFSFTSPSADSANLGNSALDPYESDNIDLGFEYYTGGAGHFGVAAFRKEITGFTINGLTTVPFNSLAQYGITFDTLNPTQQAGITARGGPDAATVIVNQQVNAEGELTVNGLEFNWVQPLDFLLGDYGLDGFGFTANLTLIDQKGTGAAPAVAIGVAPTTYNITAFYENHGVMVRLSTTYAEGAQTANANQNNIAAAALYSDDYQQWDFSSNFNLGELFGWESAWIPELTIDVINLFEEEQRSYFQFSNATFTNYDPGRQILVGLRGRF